jgi:hypothetical protein
MSETSQAKQDSLKQAIEKYNQQQKAKLADKVAKKNSPPAPSLQASKGGPVFTKDTLEEQKNPKTYFIPESQRIEVEKNAQGQVVGIHDKATGRSQAIEPTSESNIRRLEQERIAPGAREQERKVEEVRVLERRLIYEGRGSLNNEEYRRVLESRGNKTKFMSKRSPLALSQSGRQSPGREWKGRRPGIGQSRSNAKDNMKRRSQRENLSQREGPANLTHRAGQDLRR